ncbi:unnamed protein product [Meganyctiphanes norvegica]|uniref:SSD domain-containing protein n=1 Tax=Meganyctiphanes norvegica TaxID=48144 RepID=A0AAV2RF35_MEGNR
MKRVVESVSQLTPLDQSPVHEKAKISINNGSKSPDRKESLKHKGKKSALTWLSHSIIGGLEYFFYRYGKSIANRPIIYISVCLLITAVCTIGVYKFQWEERPFKLWIPQNSDFIKVMEWKKENFPDQFRIHIALYEAENVLDRNVVLEMLRVHEAVENATIDGTTWSMTCARLPSITNSLFARRKRSSRQIDEYEGTDYSTVFDRETYCDYLGEMENKCMEHSILEIWGYERDYIESLDNDDIINDLNSYDTSAVFGFPKNFSEHLGEVQRDEYGDIISAKSATQMWITKVNVTAVAAGDFIDDTGTGTEVDTVGFNWEKVLIDTVLDEADRPEGVKLFFMSSSSFGSIAGATIEKDVQFLALGFNLVFVYVQIMLGKFNLLEMRPLLSFFGLMCVGLSIAVSMGICSACGIFYGPVNSILPFLLLGLGVDDMFVIMQAWHNLTEEEKKSTISERIGHTLKHAGVSITVTSLTNFAAFAIGSGTVLPALQSFCIYAAVGIGSIYFFQATFFVAWLSYDQRRLEDRRCGAVWCWKLSDSYTPNECSKRDLCQLFFKNVVAKYLFTVPAKIIVLLVTFGVLGVSCWGLANLQQEFNPIWFIPQSTYLFQFFLKQKHYYPSNGELGYVYFDNVSSLHAELPVLDEYVTKLEESEYVSNVDSWYKEYKKYWINRDAIVPNPNQTEEEFRDSLSEFLFSSSGAKYQVRNFLFSGNTNCTGITPPILASSMEYRHRLVDGTGEQIKAMDEVKAITASMNFSGYVQPWSQAYAGWETDKIIERELYQNMGLAMLIVFLVTLILIASLPASIMVLLCVLMTLIDVGALMHWWGLTIDTVSCVDLVLAVGLCVDYAAHIAHMFMTRQGTRNERAKQAVAAIGPAVLNGGFSTFIAFIFLANSDSHVFITFFKVFFGVCLYGLFHGLVFLPVLLSLIGPAAYKHREFAYSSNKLEKAHMKEEEEGMLQPVVMTSKSTPEVVVSNPSSVECRFELSVEKLLAMRETSLLGANDDYREDSKL